jgi:hypothetical protein
MDIAATFRSKCRPRRIRKTGVEVAVGRYGADNCEPVKFEETTRGNAINAK